MLVSRQDLRLAVRSFTRHRTFTAVAVLSLALAIALNTTMYSVIDAMVSPKIDMRAPEQLYRLILWGDYKGKVDDATRASMLRTGMHMFESMGSYRGRFGLAGVEHGRRYEQVRSAIVSPNLFKMLGVHPKAGRVFTDEDFTSGAKPLLISERLAAGLFADGESPLGASINVDG